MNNNCVNGFMVSDLDITIRTLENFRYAMLDGDFDGWGLDDNMVLCVKHWLENVRDGFYSDNAR
jgi:hypothetical protein